MRRNAFRQLTEAETRRAAAVAQTPQCAALPQMEDVKYFVDLSPWVPEVDSDSDSDGDSARRHLVRVRALSVGPRVQFWG
jgi:hypothetical protein